VGATLGAAVGSALGRPALYVGRSVGVAVGALLGATEGLGVGAAALRKMTSRLPASVVPPPLKPTAEPVTAVTMVPAGMPAPVTVSPTAMDAAKPAGWDGSTTKAAPTNGLVTVTLTVWAIV
jgi:hypothetical protein